MKNPPSDKVERFLAAPSETINNPREAAKLADRKQRDAARKEREAWNKKKSKPSLEDILADVVRVAEDPATNPYHEFRAISRRRYELYGHFQIEHVMQYGRWATIKQMAELDETVGDKTLLRARTNWTLAQHDGRYIDRYIRPHMNKFPELQRATAGARMAVSISDTHSFFMDPFYWESFLAFCEDARPEVIVLLSDHVDGSEISGHPQVPGFTMSLQKELDMLRAMITEIRNRLGYDVRIVMVGDNHFFDRLVRYLTQVSRGLSGLRTLRIDRLMELDGLEVELAMGGAFISPRGQEDNRPFLRMWDRWNATHGTKLGKYPATEEILSWGTSGNSGHVHRDMVMPGPITSLREEKWMCNGSGVIDEVAKYYVRGAGPSWTRGWGIVEMHNRKLQMTSVDVSGGSAMAHGWVYEARKKLPNSGVERVKKFWLDRYASEFKSYAAE